MALIKCPECGRDVTNTNDICIHCGFPLEKPRKMNWIKKHRKKVIIASVVVALLVVVAFLFSKGKLKLPHTIQNTELMKLIDYSSEKQIKAQLGDGYEHKYSDRLKSTYDKYSDVEIDGKKYSNVEIVYESDGTYKRIVFLTDAIWSKSDYKTLVADLIEQYGSDYEYEEYENIGKINYKYTWEMSSTRRISYSIHPGKSGEEKYWVRINSFHN